MNITGSAQRLQKRNISEATCEKYKIYRDGNKLRFYYHDESGIIKGAKVKPKTSNLRKENNRHLLWTTFAPSTGKRVVITEGELDAASCAEAMPGWPMVSLPTVPQRQRKRSKGIPTVAMKRLSCSSTATKWP